MRIDNPWLRITRLVLALTLLLAYATAPARAQAQPTDGDARKLTEAAHRMAASATKLQEFTDALHMCKQALEAHPSVATRRYLEQLAGWTYNKRGETLVQLAEDTAERDEQRAAQYEEAAVRDFGLAIQLDKTNWKPRYNRAVSVAILGDYQQALDDLEVVIEQKPKHVNARYNRAEILFQLGELDRAVTDYEAVLQLDPRDVAALSGRGLAFMSLGKPDLALQDLNAVLRHEPENAEAYVDRADVYAALGRWERAAGDYRVAIGLNDKLARAYHHVAWLMATCPEARFRNPSLAVRAAKKAIQLEGSNHRNLDTLAAALARAGRFEEAKAAARQAISSAPTDEQADLQERLALYGRGRPFQESNSGRVQLASAEEALENERR